MGDSQPLKQIGRYRVLATLGAGSMARVYWGLDPNIDREVALKVFDPSGDLEPGDREELEQRFLDEARTVGRLKHPGIVTVFDAARDDETGLAYIAMELVDGAPLDDLLAKQGTLPVAKAVAVVVQIAHALDYAHGQRLVHRDVKPGNILITSHDEAKLVDFGIAKSMNYSRTLDGTLMGSPFYMSPEQVQSGAVDGRSDLFSLGTCLYHCLVGSVPFDGDSLASIVFKIANIDPRPLPRGVFPPALAECVTRSLAKDPSERFQTGAEFARELEAAIGESDSRSESQPPTVKLPSVAARPLQPVDAAEAGTESQPPTVKLPSVAARPLGSVGAARTKEPVESAAQERASVRPAARLAQSKEEAPGEPGERGSSGRLVAEQRAEAAPPSAPRTAPGDERSGPRPSPSTAKRAPGPPAPAARSRPESGSAKKTAKKTVASVPAPKPAVTSTGRAVEGSRRGWWLGATAAVFVAAAGLYFWDSGSAPGSQESREPFDEAELVAEAEGPAELSAVMETNVEPPEAGDGLQASSEASSLEGALDAVLESEGVDADESAIATESVPATETDNPGNPTTSALTTEENPQGPEPGIVALERRPVAIRPTATQRAPSRVPSRSPRSDESPGSAVAKQPGSPSGGTPPRPRTPAPMASMEIVHKNRLKEATLTVRVDGESAFVRQMGVGGVFQRVKGETISGRVPLAAGAHSVTAEIRGAEGKIDVSETLEGRFSEGATKTLRISLGARGKKVDLSWD